MISVWRIGYCPTPAPAPEVLLASLGYGSTLGNGRWHTQGPIQVVYAGASRAICQPEKRVHANGANPKDQALMRLDIAADAVLMDVVDLGLPGNWRDREAATQQSGMDWAMSGASRFVLTLVSLGSPNGSQLQTSLTGNACGPTQQADAAPLPEQMLRWKEAKARR